MIQSLLRSMELLEVLKEKNRSFTIAELADTMNLPPSTVHRILQTFCEKKYVIRDERSHTYRLGPALIPLGKAASKGIRLQDAAKPSSKTKTITSGTFPQADPAKRENISRTGTDPWPENLPKKSYACSGSKTSTPS